MNFERSSQCMMIWGYSHDFACYLLITPLRSPVVKGSEPCYGILSKDVTKDILFAVESMRFARQSR